MIIKSNFKYCLASIILIINCLPLFAQKGLINNPASAQHWVDSVFNTLNDKEKIGQLMFIRCNSNKDDKYYDNISKEIAKYDIGGICFFQGDALTQAKLTNRFQQEAKTPMIISLDAEWGLQMRLKNDCMAFPYQMTLGAIQNDSLIYEMGNAIAKQLIRIGVNMSFSPDIDINSNPANPVINYRSFGENKYNVARKGIMYMKGLQDNKVASVAKHFPGHGDTNIDSHFALPTINHSKSYLDSIDLYPFKQLISNGVTGIMTAHISFPEIDSTKNLPSSLSRPIITGILRNELNFKGLTITDGLEMKAVLNYAATGEIEAISINAGNDVQLLPVDIDKSIETILNWVKDRKLPQKRIDDACKNILYTKYSLGGNKIKNSTIDTNNILSDINTENNKVLLRKLYKNAITVIKNTNNILPLDLNCNIPTACIMIYKDSIPDFEPSFLRYTNADFYYVLANDTTDECECILSEMDRYERIIVTVSTNSNSAKNKFGISDNIYQFINTLSFHSNSIICILANPYLSSNITSLYNFNAITIGYEAVKDVFDLMPQALFGAIPINGKLPVSISNSYTAMTGINIAKSNVLYFPSREEINCQYNHKFFIKIDSLVNQSIIRHIFPGCQIFVAHNGNVILDKSYGTMDYNIDEPTSTNTLYDVASITKIAATTLAVMKLAGESRFDINLPMSSYLPYLKYTNKKNIIVKDIMAHQAKLPAYINFYKKFENDIEYRNTYLRDSMSDEYSIHVAENIYLKRNYNFYLYDSISRTNLLDDSKLPANRYLYSDLGFILLAKAIENVSLTPFDEYVSQNFYYPLGLYSTMFRPLEKYCSEVIAPTENDTTFRCQVVRGYVHDQTAALQGGVSGHAGLFTTAEQLGTIMEMLRQNGKYGNKQYLDPTIVKAFTSQQFPKTNNRRGCGFDKPFPDGGGPVCKEACSESFGHSGFTGCFTWVDPKYQLTYVFLSNRVYPDTSNNEITKQSIRNRIFQIIYEAVKNEVN